MEENYEELKLENQICFPLYACSKEIIRRYTPLLQMLDLTYTQYIVMLVMWDKKQINIKSLGKLVYLDSGTLTPLLKKLENKGYIQKNRSKNDERNVDIIITEKGLNLRNKAKSVPAEMTKCINLSKEEAFSLYKILYKILNHLDK